MDKKKLIGLRIKTMRQSRRMTQADLARAINQSQSSITMYECGRREPDFETLEALADVFNVSLSSIVADEDAGTYSVDEPRNDDVRLLIRGLNRLFPEQFQQATNVFRAMFQQTNPELFERGEDEK